MQLTAYLWVDWGRTGIEKNMQFCLIKNLYHSGYSKAFLHSNFPEEISHPVSRKESRKRDVCSDNITITAKISEKLKSRNIVSFCQIQQRAEYQQCKKSPDPSSALAVSSVPCPLLRSVTTVM